MISPINLLLLLWIVLTAAMTVTWIRRRRRAAGAGVEDGYRGRQAVSTSPLVPVAAARNIPDPVSIGVERTDSPDEANHETAITSLVPPPTAERVLPLSDILEGLNLPYDLTPVTAMVEDPDRHMIFLTTHSNAGEVGQRFADELEALGFDLESVDFDQAIALREADVVSMKIVPDADEVRNGDHPRYGAAGRGDVALELWVGRSPVPPAAPE